MKKVTLILFIIVMGCSPDDIELTSQDVLEVSAKEEEEEEEEEEAGIIGTWQRIVYDDKGTLDTRTITINENGIGNQVEVKPVWIDPCVYTSCPYYVSETTWHISFTYSVNESNTKISLYYPNYYDYINTNGEECYNCSTTLPSHENLIDIDLNMEEKTITYTDYDGTEFKYTKI